MITPADLLDYSVQEVLGAELDVRSEAVARRAVSVSYYAVFHALARVGASLFVGDEDLRERLARSFDHSSLGNAAKEIERLSAFSLIHQLTSHPEMAHFLLAPLIQRRKRG